MAKTTSKQPKAPAPTKPKAGRITKKKAKTTDFDANLFEPIPITAIEHIATKVRFAKDDHVKFFNTSTSIPLWASTSILNSPTNKTSNATIAPILKVRTNPNLAATSTDAPSTIPNTTMEEPAEEEVTTTTTAPTDAPSNLSTTTIKEEPAEEEATTNYVTIPTDVLNAVLKEEPADQAAAEVAVNHKGKAPPSKTKKAKSTRTRPRKPSSTPSPTPLPDLFQESSYLPPPKPTSSSTSSSSSTKSKFHRTPSKHILNPEHLHFRTTGNPALNSHHLLRFPLTTDHYKSLKGPLAAILKKRGLRTKSQRVKIVAFKPEYKDSQSKYLVEGVPVISGAAASNKTKEPKLLCPEWLLGGPLECGKCGSSYGRIENTKKQNNKQLNYHQGNLTKRSRAKATHGEILPSTISTCKAAGPLIYH